MLAIASGSSVVTASAAASSSAIEFGLGLGAVGGEFVHAEPCNTITRCRKTSKGLFRSPCASSKRSSSPLARPAGHPRGRGFLHHPRRRGRFAVRRSDGDGPETRRCRSADDPDRADRQAGGLEGRREAGRGQGPRRLPASPKGSIIRARCWRCRMAMCWFPRPTRPRGSSPGAGSPTFVAGLLFSQAGADVPSPNRIVLLQDKDGDGTAETQGGAAQRPRLALRPRVARRQALRRQSRRGGRVRL